MKPKWRRRSADRPDEILQASLELFIEKGFASTRMDDIAQKAGLSKAAIYLYFESKESLLGALIHRFMRPLIDDVSSIAKQSETDPKKALIACIETAAKSLSTPKTAAIPRIVLAESALFPQIAAQYHKEVIQPGFQAIGNILQNGIKAGLFHPVDIETATRIILAPLLVHFVFEPALNPSPVKTKNISHFINEHMDTVLKGIAKGKDENA